MGGMWKKPTEWKVIGMPASTKKPRHGEDAGRCKYKALGSVVHRRTSRSGSKEVKNNSKSQGMGALDHASRK